MDELPAWTNDYIGLHFKDGGRDRAGLDCWGLVRLVLRERFNCEIPSYDGQYSAVTADKEITKIVTGELPAWQKVEIEHPGDVLLIRMMGYPMHVGVVVALGWMLHIEEGLDACLENYQGLRWNKRILGFYRRR